MPFSDIDTKDAPEELLWFAPLVAAELPDLARGKDGHNPVPIVWLELLGTVDDNESVCTPTGVDGAQWPRDVEQVGRRLR